MKRVVRAFAKVNLTLEVFGVRPDGFHALRSVVLPIDLCDTLTFAPADAFSTDTGYPDDLILKAAHILSHHASADCTPYRVAVEKRIPAGGGLGGGSADAAATLLALNDLWHLGKTPEQLAAIGAEVGSDVPALVLANHYRAPVLMAGRGETVSLLEPAAARAAAYLHLVLVNPGVSSSTAAVYKNCKSRMTSGTEILYTIQTALKSREVANVASAMVNDLQEPAIALYPAIDAALTALRKTGVCGAMMSGSGSTVFGLVPTEGEGRKIATLLADQGLRVWSVAACPVV